MVLGILIIAQALPYVDIRSCYERIRYRAR